MKVIVVGTGFVGLPHAAVLAEYGHEVYAYDIDEDRIRAYETGERENIERYVNEPGLVEAIEETMGRYLHFTTSLDDVIEGTDIIYMCLPTPPKRDGSTDLSYYMNAAHYLGELLAKRDNKKRVVLVNKSTVPVGTARQRGVQRLGRGQRHQLPENAVRIDADAPAVEVGAVIAMRWREEQEGK